MKFWGFITRLFPFLGKKKNRGLKKHRTPLLVSAPKKFGLSSLLGKAGTRAEVLFSSLEELLMTADVSVKVTREILNHLRETLEKNPECEVKEVIKEYLLKILKNDVLALSPKELNILFIFGVNGVGKTTSIAKLASFFRERGESVCLAAADTYRAAAAEQLRVWANQLNIPIIAHEGKSKPSAVLYDALESAKARAYSLLLIDTAGRLHNREDLLEELAKLNRILSSKAPQAKVQNLLVLDSTMGQNALQQAKEFNQYVKISGVILSKWDSSGKGGIVLSLAGELGLPVYFVGTGEKVEDISTFSPEIFLSQLLED